MALISRIRTVATGVGGSPWYVNMHFATGEGFTVAAQHQAVVNFWTAIKSGLDSRVTYQVQGEVVEIDTTTGNAVGVIAVAPGQTGGGSNANVLPQSNQILIRLNTAAFNGGRRIKGRIFIPGVTSDTMNSDGTVKAGTATFFDQSATPLRTAGLVVYSKTSGQAPQVSGTSTWSKYAVLRSRRD